MNHAGMARTRSNDGPSGIALMVMCSPSATASAGVVDSVVDPLSYLLALLPGRLSLTAWSRVTEGALSDDLFQDFQDSMRDTYNPVRSGYLPRRAHIIHEEEEHR